MSSIVRWMPPPSGLPLRSAGGTPAPPSRPGGPLAIANATSASRVDDDRSIVDAILAGDREAFRVLVEREGPVVVRACTRIVGDRAEAEDLAQEAFVIAYRSLPTWRGEGSFGAWVARIAVRLALRLAAKRRNITWLDPFAAESELPGAAPDAVRLGTTEAPDPAVHALRAERDVELRRAVAGLDEPYREVVAMRFFAERSLQEIAEATDRPLGTVKTHLHRGLARLRKVLEEDVR